MTHEKTEAPVLTAEQIDEFRSTLDGLEQAFREYAAIKQIKDPWSYEFQSIDAEHATFGYIEWGYEPRYDGWTEHEEQMPLRFATDPDFRAELAAEEQAKRDQAEREAQLKKEQEARERAERKEQKEREQLAELLARYPEMAPAVAAGTTTTGKEG